MLTFVAALGLLAALLLLPAPVRAQDTTAPTLLGARVSGSSLVLIYDEALDTSSIPAASAYSVVVGTGGTGATPTAVGISGTRVTLTLPTAAISTDAVTVTYTKPSTTPLQDGENNDVENLSSETVANNTSATNAQPVFSSAATTRSVAETNTSGTVVGDVVRATDTDTDTLTYALVGPDASSFTIDTTSGQIKTMDALDFETPPTSYSVVVSVRDNIPAAGGTDTDIDDAIAVTINVTNVNEAPVITTTTSTISKPENTATSEILETYQASDEDASTTFTWTLTGTDAGDFTIVGGVLKFSSVPDFESRADNVYEVMVNVSDGSLSATQDVTITVTDVNEAPVITTTGSSHTSISKAENTGTSVVLATYQADDPESNPLTWSLSGHNNDTGAFTIVGGVLKFRNVPDFESPADNGLDNVYNLTVNVEDNFGTSIDNSVPVIVYVTNADEAGTASFTGTLSGGSTLTASVTDPDGGIGSKSYQWQRGNTASGSFSPISGETDSTYTLVAMDVGKWLKVKVSYADAEGAGKSATSVSRGPIGASNSEPTFNDGMTATRTLPENSDVGVNVVGGVTAATDSDGGDTLTYSLAGTDAGKFEVDSNGQIKTRSTGSAQTFNFEDAGNNSFSVTVRVHDGKDAAGDPDTSTIDDTIAVTINLTNVNEKPALTSPPTALSKPENSTAVHEYAATDVDAMTTFSWRVTGADADKFEISSTGVLTFSNAPDFETPTDTGDMNGDNIYVVTVRVDDNGSPMMHDVHTLRLTVTNINEAPEITSTGTTFTAPSFDENGTSVVATYTATDVDANSNLTWSVENNDFGDFNITKNTTTGNGELTFKMPPNYEAPIDADTNNTYSVTVKVRDNHSGQLSDTLTVVVTVNDVNETPVISGDDAPDFAEIEFDASSVDLTVGAYTYTDEDRNPADTITWDLSGTDAAHFSISSGGELSFSIQPNFEVPVDMSSGNDYVIVVEANDGEGGVGTFNVTVTVDNVDETPEVTSNNPAHTFDEIEYDYVHVAADLSVDIFTARDEEDGIGGIIWAVSGRDVGHFTISSGTTTGEGVLFFRIRPDFEVPVNADTDNVYEVTLIARDTTGVQKSREYPVTVTVTDVNERPDIDENFDAPQNYMEIEYDFTGTRPLVHTFTATDYDDGDTFTWMVTGTDAAYLDIGASDGILNFTQDSGFNHGPLPNFEHPRDDGSNNTYNITVVATDNHAKAEEYVVIVTVTDVNEEPEFTGTITLAKTVDEHDKNDAYVVADLLHYTARDEEGGVTWSLSGTDSGDFAISTDGVVTFAATPNYEEPEDSGGGNVYNFTVVATDVQSGSSRHTASVDVTVTVSDVEEAGTLAVDELDIAVGDSVTFTLTDPDGGIDLTPPTQGQPPPIDWTLQLRLPMEAWQTKQTNNPLGTEFRYVVDEDDTGKEMRVVVTYSDRRGPGKSVTSMETEAITADPIPNAKPRFTSSGTQNVEEGDTGRTVGIPITASDRDNDSLTFSIEGAHSDKFELVVDNNATVPTVRLRTAQALDYETTSGPLFLQVAVHDGKGLDASNNVISDDSIDATTTVTVTILDVEEDGVLTLSDDEPGVGTQITTDFSDGDSINSNGNVTGATWQWARSGNVQTGWVNISGATSPSYTTTQADADFFLRARIEYTDTRGGGKSAEAITTERVFGENQRPTFPSTESGARTVEENTRAGVSIGAPVAAEDQDNDRLTYSLSGTDAAAFSIVASTGQLRTLEPLDFEDKSSYRVNVEVHDGLDGLGQPSTSIDETQAVTITIENVEEQGTVTLSSDTGTIQARVPVMATLADDDRPTGVVMWQWWRSPNGRTDWVNIAGAMSATFEPTDDDQGKYIRATASYRDGEGQGKTAIGVSPRVGNAPPVNSAPMFPSTENGQREVAENTGSGNVGARFEATDFNNDTLYYSLSGTDAASFEIGRTTGQIQLASGVTLDFEGKRSYRFTVEVGDGKDPLDDPDDPNDPNVKATDDRQSVTVTVTNVNEGPEVTGDTAPSFVENKSSAVASYSAADPERDTLTWTVSDSDFWISQRGQLYFRTPPSYEVRESYSVNVRAEDDGGLRDSLSVTVTVTDSEESGVVTLSLLRGWDGTTFMAALDDDDGVVESSVDWQWQRSSNRSSWNDITGQTSIFYTATADDVGQYLRVTAEYTDRLDSGKTASAILAGRIANSADRPSQNNEPVFANAMEERSVGQGTAAGRSVGAPVRAIDDDPGDILTYGLSGQDADMFDIDTATGQLRTHQVLDYDPEGANTYSVQVSVHDGYAPDYQYTDVGVDATIEVTITVTRVTRRPPPPPPPGGVTVAGSDPPGGVTVAEPAPPGFAEGSSTTRFMPASARPGDAVGRPVVATHPSNLSFTYSLSGTDSANFTVDETTGQIRLGQAVSLEAGDSYTVTLRASVAQPGGSTLIVGIEVSIRVIEPEPPAVRYDLNRNGTIEKDEVLAAVSDYFADIIEKDEVLALVALYFAA